MSEEAVVLAKDEPLVAPVENEETRQPSEATTEASAGEEKPVTTEVETPEQVEARKVQERIQRGINKATRRFYAEKARADLLAQQLNEAKAKMQSQQVDNAAPRLEQFDYDPEKYAKAYAEYETKKTLSQQKTHAASLQVQAQIHKLQSEWDSRVAKAEEKYEDFDAIVGELKPTTPWAISVMRSENGPDIAHYLGTHMDEAKRIASLPAAQQQWEIGRLSAKLELTPSASKKPSGAPAPISPVGGKSGGGGDLPQDTDDINTWMRKENARMRKAAGL